MNTVLLRQIKQLNFFVTYILHPDKSLINIQFDTTLLSFN
jgi:hypothetical protein